MLFVLLVLSVLSLRLFLAEQRANRNAQLALDASAEILQLMDPGTAAGDPSIREVRVRTAISYLETLRIDDPENLKCLTNLRALYAAFGDLLRDRNQLIDAQVAYQKADSMVIPIALGRLRAWQPPGPSGVRQLSRQAFSFRDNYERDRLQTLLAIGEQVNGSTSVKNALDYAELAAEYLLLIDTSTKAGRTEARRVLQLSLKKFEETRASEPLSPQVEELVEAVKRTVDLLSRYD